MKPSIITKLKNGPAGIYDENNFGPQRVKTFCGTPLTGIGLYLHRVAENGKT
jgi:hypothetical protein